MLFLITSYNLRVFYDVFNSSDPYPFFNVWWFWTPALITALPWLLLTDSGPKTDRRFRTGYKGNVTPRHKTDDENNWEFFGSILVLLYATTLLSWFIKAFLDA